MLSLMSLKHLEATWTTRNSVMQLCKPDTMTIGKFMYAWLRPYGLVGLARPSCYGTA